LGLSQEKLAEEIEMSRVSVVNIEKGRQSPPLHLLWVIAKNLNVEFESLLPKAISQDIPEINSRLQKIIDRKSKEASITQDSVDKLNLFLRGI